MVSCLNDQMKFDRQQWNERSDLFYKNREAMVNDLIENHLQKGMTYNEVKELLGQPENYGNMKPNTFGYEIMVDYGWNIDPVEGKTLLFEISNDSVVINYHLNHWEH